MTRKPQTRVVMVGPRLDAVGGIAEVERVLVGRLSDRFDMRVIGTIGGGSRLTRSMHSISGVVRAVAATGSAIGGVVHIHVASRGSFVRKNIVARWCGLIGRPYVVHLHGGGFEEYYDRSSSAHRRRISRFFSDAGRVLVLGRKWADFVRSIAPTAVVDVLPNPAHILANSSDHSATRILFVGDVTERKGIPELLTAFGREAEAFPEWRLSIAGRDATELVKDSTMPSYVDYRGILSEQQLDAERLDSSVFCLPSHAEGLPLSLLDAMGAGLCCVATDVGAVGEHVVDGVSGFLVRPGDVDALATALRTAMSDPELRRRMGAAAREHVMSCCAPGVVAAKVARVYEEVAR